MTTEDRVRHALSARLAGANASPEAWTSILRRIARRERIRVLRVRIVTSFFALALSAITVAALWTAFRPTHEKFRPGAVTQDSEASPSPTQTVCSESESSGDFDGDRSVDRAKLYALVPVPQSDCGPSALETKWRFELKVELRSTTVTVPFTDCESLFDCQLLEGSDFDGDGRAELPVMLSMAASSVTGLYRLTGEGIEPLSLAPPGDPGFLEPGPIHLGGEQDAIMSSGFVCRIEDDGSRVLVAWSAERDDAVSPYRMHLTTLELNSDTFRVIATEDRQDVTALPPRHAICP